MHEELPGRAKKLAEAKPEIWKAFQALGKACAEAGPLDNRTLRLVKLALAVGRGTEGAVHSHVRRAIEEGLSPDELRHVAVAAIPTLGFGASVAALSWIEDIVGQS
jgi:alkylhydroperoxidase/carboxymuconolactone decarboxylase family protein YurZ